LTRAFELENDRAKTVRELFRNEISRLAARKSRRNKKRHERPPPKAFRKNSPSFKIILIAAPTNTPHGADAAQPCGHPLRWRIPARFGRGHAAVSRRRHGKLAGEKQSISRNIIAPF